MLVHVHVSPQPVALLTSLTRLSSLNTRQFIRSTIKGSNTGDFLSLSNIGSRTVGGSALMRDTLQFTKSNGELTDSMVHDKLGDESRV